MQKKFLSYVLGGLLVMSLMLAVVPTAQAQDQAPTRLQVNMDAINEPIRPLSGFYVGSGSVEYFYHASGTSALANTQVNLRVTESPSWATVTVSPASIFFTVGSSGGTPGGQMVSAGSEQFKVFVSTTADAPAFQPAKIRVSAQAEPNSPLAGSTGDDNVPVEADFFSIIDSQVNAPIRVVRPQTTVDFPVTVSNFGNANTRVTVDLKERGNLVVPTPQPVTLQAEQMGGEQIQTTISLSMETPFKNGYMNRADVVDAQLNAAYALDTSKEGDSMPLSVMVTTKGFYVPGAGALVFLGVLGLTAFLLPASRRRNR